MPLIAGHNLITTPHGRACEWCGRTWVSLLDQRDRWREREAGIAHAGNLSAEEVVSLWAEVDRIWEATVAAAVATGMASAPTLPETSETPSLIA